MTQQKKIIRSVQEMPAWFDLKNYDVTKNFTILQWAYNFMYRSSILASIKANEPHIRVPEAIESVKNGCYFLSLPKFNDDIRHVNHFSFFEAKCIYDEILEIIQKDDALKDLVDDKSDFTGEKAEKMDEMNWHDFCRDSWDDDIFCKVDLAALDEVLVDDFLAFVHAQRKKRSLIQNINPNQKRYKNKSIRKHYNINERFSLEDKDYWFNNRILPYSDLMLVSKHEGYRITEEALADALFPELKGCQTSSKRLIDDNIKPYFKLLVDNRITARAILSQADA